MFNIMSGPMKWTMADLARYDACISMNVRLKPFLSDIMFEGHVWSHPIITKELESLL